MDKTERYELVSGLQDFMYPYQFARIQDKETTYILRRRFNFIGGLSVDVFPLDGMIEDGAKRYTHYARYKWAKKNTLLLDCRPVQTRTWLPQSPCAVRAQMRFARLGAPQFE